MEVTTQARGIKARLVGGDILTAPRLEMMAYLVDEPITVGMRDDARIVIDRENRFFEVVTRFGIQIARQISLTTRAFLRVWNTAWTKLRGDQRMTLLERLGKSDAAANVLTMLALTGKVVA